VVKVDQTPPRQGSQIKTSLAESVMTNDKHRRYANYAARCLSMGVAENDPSTSAFHREMALEWLKLADGVLHPTEGAKFTDSLRT
jgi:hypothetical protein